MQLWSAGEDKGTGGAGRSARAGQGPCCQPRPGVWPRCESASWEVHVLQSACRAQPVCEDPGMAVLCPALATLPSMPWSLDSVPRQQAPCQDSHVFLVVTWGPRRQCVLHPGHLILGTEHVTLHGLNGNEAHHCRKFACNSQGWGSQPYCAVWLAACCAPQMQLEIN